MSFLYAMIVVIYFTDAAQINVWGMGHFVTPERYTTLEACLNGANVTTREIGTANKPNKVVSICVPQEVLK
jgi:hypothetical protein